MAIFTVLKHINVITIFTMKPIIKLIILIAGLTLSIGGLGVLTDDYTSNNILTTMSMGLFGVLLFLGGILAIVSSGAIDFLDKGIKNRLLNSKEQDKSDEETKLPKSYNSISSLKQTIKEKDTIITLQADLIARYITEKEQQYLELSQFKDDKRVFPDKQTEKQVIHRVFPNKTYEKDVIGTPKE